MAEDAQQRKSSRIGYGHPPEGTPWKPGQSGNPNGRPVNENSITYWLKQELARANGGGRTNAQNIAKKMIVKAKSGELDAMKEIADRTEGKPKQRTEVTGENGGPVNQHFDISISFGGDDDNAESEDQVSEALP